MPAHTITLHPGARSLPSIFTAHPEARPRLRDFFNDHEMPTHHNLDRYLEE